MPELPEVETTRRGILPHILDRPLGEVVVRESRLRHAVSPTLERISGDRVTALRRRGKYLVFSLARSGHLLVHLGMSGSLRIVATDSPCRRHDHILIDLPAGRQLRYHDPRRFGIFLHLAEGDPDAHPLLAALGPEPLSEGFGAPCLIDACRGRSRTIKAVIMDPRVVVGVGNIYASEALFRAGIRPRTAARRLSRPRLAALAESIREVLAEAIEQGGTTLRDFVQSDGQPGYFRQSLFVYDRADQPCRACAATIRQAIIAQRSTYWCPECQR